MMGSDLKKRIERIIDGKVQSVRMIMFPGTHKSKGQAIVTLSRGCDDGERNSCIEQVSLMSSPCVW